MQLCFLSDVRLVPQAGSNLQSHCHGSAPFNHVCGGLQDFTVWWEQEPALGNGRGFPAKKELTKEFSSNFLPFVL